MTLSMFLASSMSVWFSWDSDIGIGVFIRATGLLILSNGAAFAFVPLLIILMAFLLRTQVISLGCMDGLTPPRAREVRRIVIKAVQRLRTVILVSSATVFLLVGCHIGSTDPLEVGLTSGWTVRLAASIATGMLAAAVT